MSIADEPRQAYVRSRDYLRLATYEFEQAIRREATLKSQLAEARGDSRDAFKALDAATRDFRRAVKQMPAIEPGTDFPSNNADVIASAMKMKIPAEDENLRQIECEHVLVMDELDKYDEMKAADAKGLIEKNAEPVKPGHEDWPRDPVDNGKQLVKR